MKAKLTLLVLVTLFAVVACGMPPETVAFRSDGSAIMGGVLDTGHPAVVAVVNVDAMYGCTGTFIDPTTVLTAAHCALDADPAHYVVAGGVYYPQADWIAHVRIVAYDDRYVPGTADSGHDIGIVIIDPETPLEGDGVLPAPVPWLSVVTDEAYAAGTSFTQVGYGVTSASSNNYGAKRSVTLTSTSYTTDRFFFGDATTGVCFGDSGGPSLVTMNGVETVSAVASYVLGACEQQVAMRTDYEAGFIQQYIGLVTPTPTPTPPAPTPTPPEAEPHGGGGGCGISL